MKYLLYCLAVIFTIVNIAYGELKNPHNEEPAQIVKDVMQQYGIEQGDLKIIEEGFWQFVSESSAVVAFETSERATSKLEYGETDFYGTTIEGDGLRYIHIYYLRNLKPDKTYHYKFTAVKHDGTQEVTSGDMTVCTFQIPDAVRVPQDIGGNPPYVLDQENTYYLLTEDIDADSSAIIFTGAGSTLDLGGHTVVYNEIPLRIPTDQWTPHRNGSSFGIKMRAAGANMRVFNGRIVQGKGNDTSSYVSLGFNPIYVSGAPNLEIAGLDINYTGVQITGIYCHWPGEGYSIHHNIVTDSGKYIINRHQQVSAIKMNSPGRGKLYNNLIRRARQTALALGKKSEAYHNEIHVDSYSINSFGIGAKDTSKVYGNRIFGCGDNTCAIATTSTADAEVFDNYIWLQAHSLEDYLPWLNPEEMESTTTSTMSAIRVTWGGKRISYHDNVILVTSREGGIVRGAWLYSDNNTSDVKCENNLFIALAEDDSSGRWGAIGGVGNHSHDNAPPISFINNTIVSNFTNYSMKDSYGYSMNYLFINNTFVKAGDFEDYYTINSHEGYSSKGAVFIDSKFEGGAGYDQAYMSRYSEDEFTVKWTLHVLAPAGTGIVISDKDNNTVENETVPETGKIDFVLTEYKRIVNDKEYKSPYTVTAKHNGEEQSETVVLDSIKTLKFFDETDVEQLFDTDISISPNPARDYVDITMSESTLKDAVRIYDVLGVCVMEHTGGGQLRIDVSGLAAGVYFVRVGSEVYRFVKL